MTPIDMVVTIISGFVIFSYLDTYGVIFSSPEIVHKKRNLPTV